MAQFPSNHNIPTAYPQHHKRQNELEPRRPSWSKVNHFVSAMHFALYETERQSDADLFDLSTTSLLLWLARAPVVAGAEIMATPERLAEDFGLQLEIVLVRLRALWRYRIISAPSKGRIKLASCIRILLFSKHGRFRGWVVSPASVLAETLAHAPRGVFP